MKPFARTARRGLGWLVFAGGNLAALGTTVDRCASHSPTFAAVDAPPKASRLQPPSLPPRVH